MNNLPTWAKIIFNWGLPASIVFFFLFQQAGYIPSTAASTHEVVKAHAAETKALDQAQLEALRAIVEAQREAARLLRIQCLKAAQTDQDRQNCL